MAEKITIMVLKVVNLKCPHCYKKIKKLLCKFPEIRDQKFDIEKNAVMITVVCCSPEKIRDKLCCKGGKSIICIEIIKEPPPKPKPEPPPKPKPNTEQKCEPPESRPQPPTEPKPKTPEKRPQPPTEPKTKTPEKPAEPVCPDRPCCGPSCYAGGPCYCGSGYGRPVPVVVLPLCWCWYHGCYGGSCGCYVSSQCDNSEGCSIM